jgi:DNA-binding MarR family transcriptional regulator
MGEPVTNRGDSVDEIAVGWERERPGTPVDSIGVVTRIWRLGKLFADDRRRVLVAAGLDSATLDLLSMLRRAGPPYQLTTRELATRTLVTAGAISQRVARAERDGLVTRAAGTGRAVVVTLTDRGQSVVEASVEQVLVRESSLLDGLSPQQRRQLAGLLRTLLADVQNRLAAEGVAAAEHTDELET